MKRINFLECFLTKIISVFSVGIERNQNKESKIRKNQHDKKKSIHLHIVTKIVNTFFLNTTKYYIIFLKLGF